MHAHTLRLAAAALAGGLLFHTVPTSAQDVNPEEGGMWVPPPDDGAGTTTDTTGTGTGTTQGTQQQGGTAWYDGGPTGAADDERPPAHGPATDTTTASTTTTTPPPAAEEPSDGRSDHQRVVGRLAVGYMGLTAVPIGTTGVPAPDFTTVSAPALGIRYWLGELVGLDVGIGLGFLGGNSGTGMSSSPIDNAFAMTIHAGLPLAVFHHSHYKLIIVPEANIGFSTGTHFGAMPSADRGRSGFLFQIGGRLGTEIHFGFMDIPNLSLQASVGLYFEYASANVGAPQGGGAAAEEVNSRYGIGTTVMGEPWDILLGALTALYYF